MMSLYLGCTLCRAAADQPVPDAVLQVGEQEPAVEGVD